MASQNQSPWTTLLEDNRPKDKVYEDLYKHFHAHPELSNQEKETASTIEAHLKELSPDLDIRTGIGGHGLIAVLKNGKGKTILLRADMDALPLREKTELEYASTAMTKDADGYSQCVMHACGHDFHITALLAAAATLLAIRDSWSGTVIFLFQPAEERGTGAKAMVDDGLYDQSKHNCPIPDIVLGQHVFPIPAGTVATRHGVLLTAADSMKITVYGKGGHGSMPQMTIDPVIIAASIVLKLQTIASRELPPGEIGVLTVGSIQAGETENVIADEAVLKLDIRTVSDKWRKHILSAIKRIVKAECDAARSPKPPLFEPTRQFPRTVNDEHVCTAVRQSFETYFGKNHDGEAELHMASEDFSVLATSVERPYMFWFFGGYEGERVESEEGVPNNHSPYFAPDLQPTLRTGTDALVVATLTFVGKTGGV